MNNELMEIETQMKALQKSIDALNRRRDEIRRHERDALSIEGMDGKTINSDTDPAMLNYILGHSEGYVAGFKSAVNEMIVGLANEYRDIPMTESELYLLTELGSLEERAFLKNHKQIKIMEDSGWEQDWNHSGSWKRKEDADDTN